MSREKEKGFATFTHLVEHPAGKGHLEGVIEDHEGLDRLERLAVAHQARTDPGDQGDVGEDGDERGRRGGHEEPRVDPRILRQVADHEDVAVDIEENRQKSSSAAVGPELTFAIVCKK